MEGEELLKHWGLDDPDLVGASEYRAIWGCLADALTNLDEVADAPEVFVFDIIEEFESYLQSIRRQLWEYVTKPL